MKVKRKTLDIPSELLHQIIVSTWKALRQTAIGSEELLAIQSAVAASMNEDQLISPAAIARELAREGAELRHPEIIECDARWRASQYVESEMSSEALRILFGKKPPTLSDADAVIGELERLRNQDPSELDDDVRLFAVDARLMAENRADDDSLSPPVREVQKEIAEWLRVWLETPAIFAQWIELRKQSEAFRTRFGPN
jgi:hypothetical protein